jgi:hypothetical protein
MVQNSEVWNRVVVQKFTDVSGERTPSVFTIEDVTLLKTLHLKVMLYA